MHTHTKVVLLCLFVLVICASSHGVHAFGAGNIPSFAYLEGRAFRHGDIEDTLADIAKKGGFALGSLIGKGKFGGLDIKRVYFGNWLRDYSQAVDIASLKKLPLQTILNLCMALGFLAHGYATAEFEVTKERLGCYLPVEHIDNPKGYGEGEDARKYHPGLRPPVQPAELEVDPRTGMKNYIANENGNWDTSKAHVRRIIQQCVDAGRRGGRDNEYEALRLLGTFLHTLEDFPAHSNFCELALVAMGHRDVFVHIGDQVRVSAPGGKSVAPLVTGTFGGSDFIHSLLGEATDHISSASVSDLNRELATARSKSAGGGGGGPGSRGGMGPADTLRDLLFNLPGGSGGDMSRDMEGIERIRAGGAAGGKNPEQMSPQELYATMWQVLTFRDNIVKKIEATIEKIPGLGPLIEKLMDSISVFVFTTLEPYLKPIMKSASTGLMSASSEVIDTHDQYEVFNDPRASDPTHSFLSKDHFNLILNEPAGRIAKVIVLNTVPHIVKAWSDTSVNVHQMSEEILQCLFHPDFHNNGSKVQREMMQAMHEWVGSLGKNQHEIIRRLGKNQVRNHENIRMGGEGGKPAAQGGAAYNAGVQAQANIQGYLNNIPGVSQAQNIFNQFGGPQGPRRDIGMPGGPPGGPSTAPPPLGAMNSSGGLPSGVSAGGLAASFYQDSTSAGTPSQSSTYNPSGPPSAPPSARHDSSYMPPMGPPPGHSSFSPPPGMPPGAHPTFSPPPGMPSTGGYSEPPPLGGGYAPAYTPSYSGGPPGAGGPGFPDSGGPMRMPSMNMGGGGGPMGFPSPAGPPPFGGGGYASPPGPPPGGFPSPFGPPGGGPPQFPGGPPGPHDHGHHHQYQQGYGPPPGGGPGYGGGW